MAKGIEIRRHQKNKTAETVRLFSTTGCKIIQWERIDSLNADEDSEEDSHFEEEFVNESSRKYTRNRDMSLFHFFATSKKLFLLIVICFYCFLLFS
jgi:hypothetical protein